MAMDALTRKKDRMSQATAYPAATHANRSTSIPSTLTQTRILITWFFVGAVALLAQPDAPRNQLGPLKASRTRCAQPCDSSMARLASAHPAVSCRCRTVVIHRMVVQTVCRGPRVGTLKASTIFMAIRIKMQPVKSTQTTSGFRAPSRRTTTRTCFFLTTHILPTVTVTLEPTVITAPEVHTSDTVPDVS